MQDKSSYYVYDVRSGVIHATYHLIGTPHNADEELHSKILNQTHEASTIPLEHFAVLSESEIPPGEGPLYVDMQSRKLVRGVHHTDLRIRA
jgi:hypothetical protein